MTEQYTKIDGVLYKCFPIDADEERKFLEEQLTSADGRVAKATTEKTRIQTALSDLTRKR